MSTNLFRNLLLCLSLMALMLMALVAYGSYRSAELEDDMCGLRVEATHSTDLPWEALTKQWFRAVSL